MAGCHFTSTTGEGALGISHYNTNTLGLLLYLLLKAKVIEADKQFLIKGGESDQILEI